MVKPQWNLCNAPGPDEVVVDKSKVAAVAKFLQSDDQVLVCTHATFRFAVRDLGVEAFDGRLIAIDEFHHVSAGDNNILGAQLAEFLAREKVHVVAMTGSYFRGDAVAVLKPEDEAKFETVTCTYYEQLNGYDHLKSLDLGYYFYGGSEDGYLDAIMQVLDPAKKTIIHIPNVNSRASTLRGKLEEVNHLMGALGEWQGEDAKTGFHLVKPTVGRVLRIANLVDDLPVKRERVMSALKDPAQKDNRDHVDIIIALGMAKEGFDWIWCEHALTIGHRNSLTEVIQIIGRATRDAPGKTTTRFTNLIAQPDAAAELVVEAVNDTLKAIAASLLMEQVLAPRFNFTPKHVDNGPQEGFDYGEGGYQKDQTNVGFSEEAGQIHVEIKGLVEPTTKEGQRIIREDLNELIADFVQDARTVERGLFDDTVVPEELTQVRMGKIIADKYPDIPEDHEAIRQRAIAGMAVIQQTKKANMGDDGQPRPNTAFVDAVRRFVNVRDLDIDLIDRINPFDTAYAVLSKTMDEKSLRQVQEAIASKRPPTIPPDEALQLARRAAQFKKERGKLPDIGSTDAWEKKLAEGRLAFAKHKTAGAYDEA